MWVSYPSIDIKTTWELSFDSELQCTVIIQNVDRHRSLIERKIKSKTLVHAKQNRHKTFLRSDLSSTISIVKFVLISIVTKKSSCS